MLNKCLLSGFADEIDQSLEAQIKLLNEIEQKYIEFRSAENIGVAGYTLEQAKEVTERLLKEGIRLSSVGSPIGKIEITDDFEPHFERFKHVVDIAKTMGTKNIRMFSFFIPDGEDPYKYEKEVYARTDRMVDYAEKQNVVLLHENEKRIFGDVAERCVRLMERFYCDNYKCVFDFANFIQCKQDTWEAYEMLKPYITYIHVKDAIWETGEVVVPGTGDGQLLKIFEALDASGYDGFLSLEPHLADFAGLSSLERNPAGRKLSDGEAAYMLAYNGLEKLLKQ